MIIIMNVAIFLLIFNEILSEFYRKSEMTHTPLQSRLPQEEPGPGKSRISEIIRDSSVGSLLWMDFLDIPDFLDFPDFVDFLDFPKNIENLENQRNLKIWEICNIWEIWEIWKIYEI